MCYLTHLTATKLDIKKWCNKQQIQDSRLPIMAFFWYQTDTPLPSQDTLYLLHCDVKIFNVKQYQVNLALVPLLSKSHKVQAKVCIT